ncbi:2OG-Fe(II) oxygenase [Dactylosporangium sp. NPDC049525]|uniref:2OG-Fe(II) oxygenase n=1 Tax=Dactylosporangium sp. NPDC049525 TaxID=3154730 RepID=UPI00342BE31E
MLLRAAGNRTPPPLLLDSKVTPLSSERSGAAAMIESDGFFGLRTTDRLDRELLIALATRQIGAVHVKGLVAAQDCDDVVDRLEKDRLNAFDLSRYQVPTFNLGPILNHYLPQRRITQTYWDEARHAEDFWEGCEPDVRAQCFRLLAEAWGATARQLHHDGRPLFRGIVRDNSNGAPPHWDDLAIEFPPGFVVPVPIVQLSFVLYLRMPASGGETDIWPRRWVPGDDRFRVGSCWPDLPLGAAPLSVRATAGDAVIFDPRHYHQVRPGLDGRRLTLASYLGITADGALVAWS